jgi:hypothetical protein
MSEFSVKCEIGFWGSLILSAVYGNVSEATALTITMQVFWFVAATIYMVLERRARK